MAVKVDIDQAQTPVVSKSDILPAPAFIRLSDKAQNWAQL